METLNDLKVGQKCVVEKVTAALDMRRRLMDLGIVKNTEIECALISPGGDPKAFYIKGALIALRKEDSSNIFVRICNDDSTSSEKGCNK